MKFNTGFICFSSGKGGLELLTANLAHQLQERQNNIFFISDKNSFLSEEIRRNQKILLLEISKPLKYYDILRANKVSAFLKRNLINNVICTDTKDLNFCSLVKMFYGKSINLLYLQNMQIGVNKKDIFHTITYSAIDKWICSSNYLALQVTEMTKVPNDKITVIPFGVEFKETSKKIYSKNEAKELYGISGETFTIGIMGRIDRYKGQETVIRALDILNNKYFINSGLIIAGEKTFGEADDYYENLIKLIKEKNLNHKVHFPGFVKDNKSFYKALDVFVLSSACESFGIVTIEAMLNGIPVIGTNTGATPELIHNGKFGLTFTPFNEIELAEKIKYVFDNPEVTEKTALEAKEYYAGKYTYENMCRSIESLLR